MNHTLLIFTILLISLTPSQQEDSFYTVRMNKNLIKEVFQKNLAIIFDKSKSFDLNDIYLEDLKTTMTNVEVKVKPLANEANPTPYEDSEVEVFFNEGTISIEMHDLNIFGNTSVKDPDTGILEKISFRVPVSVGYIEITPA